MAASLNAWGALPNDIKVTPEPGSTLTEINEFTITSGWLEKKNGVDATQLLVNGKTYTANIDAVNFDALKFTLQQPITSSGEYAIIVPEDIFFMGWDYDPNPIIEFSYTVKNDNGGGDDPGIDDVQNVVPEGYAFTPAAGTEIPVLTSFSVTAEVETFLTPASRKCPISINGTSIDAVVQTGGDMGNTLTWELAKPINAPGYYTIYIPEGTFFGYSETDNKAFIVTLIVTGGELPEPTYYNGEVTSDPAAGSTVAQLGKIAVMYPKLTSVYKGPECGGITVTTPSGVAGCRYTLTPDPDDFNDAHVMWLEFTPALTEKGEYTISFPAQCFEIAKYPSNWYSAPFTLTFNVDPQNAISDIATDTNTDAVFYTTSGIRLTQAPTSGIYLQIGRAHV